MCLGTHPGAKLAPRAAVCWVVSSNELRSKTGACFIYSFHCLRHCLAHFNLIRYKSGLKPRILFHFPHVFDKLKPVRLFCLISKHWPFWGMIGLPRYCAPLLMSPRLLCPYYLKSILSSKFSTSQDHFWVWYGDILCWFRIWPMFYHCRGHAIYMTVLLFCTVIYHYVYSFEP